MFGENARHVVQLVELAKVNERGHVLEAEPVVLQDVHRLLEETTLKNKTGVN